MKDEVITVMVLRAGEFMPEVKTIPNELKAMQEQGWTEDDFRREFGKSYL